MYKPFYGLTRNPFELSPDPYFFYPTHYHNEALAQLIYGVVRRRGFIVLTGEVGTGKTLVVRCLLDSLSRNKVQFAFVYNPVLSVQSFLEHVLTEFGLSPTARTKSEALSRLNTYLMTRASGNMTTALVVDDAQLLSWNLLEEIRLLTNLETTQHKLLQIVLVGQTEFDSKLDSGRLRQLKQRVGLRCTLNSLQFVEVEGYIRSRLDLAGAQNSNQSIFSREAIEAIYEISQGIPRLVNVLCENSLMLGYSIQANPITAEVVREAASDLHLMKSNALIKSVSRLQRTGDRLEFVQSGGRERVGDMATELLDGVTLLPRAKSE